jgi:hypothetical protein
MKKALIVFLILAVAGGLFADPGFTGSVKTGALFTFSDDAAYQARGKMSDGWRDEAVRAALSFTNGGDDFGVTISGLATVPNNVDKAGAGGINIDAFNGWVTFAQMFTLTAGKGIGGNWQATSDVFDRNISSSNAGARLNIKPIPGLDFGLAFGYPNQGSNAKKFENFLKETGIGAKYDAGIFVVGTSLDLRSEEFEGYPDMDGNWLFDAKIPLAGLFTVHLDGYIDNLFGKKDDQDIEL